jgi:hypothetical protein
VADCKWPSRARIPGGLVPGTVARGRLAFLAARTVTAPPGRDMANSATSPILQQRQPELQVGGVAYRCPIEFRHQVGTLGRPTWRTTAPGGRTLFWTLVPRRPSHPQPRPAAPSWPRARLPCAPLPAVWRAVPRSPPASPSRYCPPTPSSSCGGSAQPNEQPSDKAL